MKVLVIGSGGREHALVWKFSQSKMVEKIWAAPGNGGCKDEKKAECFPMAADPASEEGQKILLEFAQKEKIDLTVVGPEAPLASGIVDLFRSSGFAIFGPDKSAARLESSKVFSKKFMTRYGVRNGRSNNYENAEEALSHIKKHFETETKPLVIKADGLAAGKGVLIAADGEEAAGCVLSFMADKSLGEAGKSIIIEEFLEGREVSIMAAVSAKPGAKAVVLPFIVARDHKSRYEGGKGPNTGGMGAIAPVPDFGKEAFADFENAILLPTKKGLEEEQMDYRGFIFFGLMVKDNVCNLLEYNVRLGDPETQALMQLLDSDLADLCLSFLGSNPGSFRLEWKNKASCAPVAVAHGYPDAYRRGDHISIDKTGLEKTGAKVFAAGAQKKESGLVTSGGRVLSVCATGDNAEDARKKAYEALGCVHFDGMEFRTDIGLQNE